MILDRSIYFQRLGDPATWTGDWRRHGNYLDKARQEVIASRMRNHEAMIVGMAVRRVPSSAIAAVMCVSREAVDRRLRPLGLKNAPGQVGRPATQVRT